LKVAVLWTGGKDSALAYLKVQKTHNVAMLVNFIWEKPSISHPNLITKLQSEALKEQFLWDRLQPPYHESYRESILDLKNEYGIQAVVTGDITADTFHGTWIDEVCKNTGVEVIKPLWEQKRRQLMEEIVGSGLKVIFTCVKEPWFTEEWLGRTIDEKCLQDLETLHEKNDVDLCGEFGEYHTMVMDAPFFTKTIRLSTFKKQKTSDSFIMEPIGLSLKPKMG
jgi:diphthine-ammonia ligase